MSCVDSVWDKYFLIVTYRVWYHLMGNLYSLFSNADQGLWQVNTYYRHCSRSISTHMQSRTKVSGNETGIDCVSGGVDNARCEMAQVELHLRVTENDQLDT